MFTPQPTLDYPFLTKIYPLHHIDNHLSKFLFTNRLLTLHYTQAQLRDLVITKCQSKLLMHVAVAEKGGC